MRILYIIFRLLQTLPYLQKVAAMIRPSSTVLDRKTVETLPAMKGVSRL